MLIRFLIIGALGYAALVVLAYLFQPRLVHLPHVPGRSLAASPADVGLAYESVNFEATDGVVLHGWWIPAEGARATILIFHGNAGNISHRLETIQIWHSLGLNVFIFDYRGYGQSGGRPSEPGLYRDGEAAFRYVVDERGVSPGEVILFGRSLGAAVAARTAVHHEPAGLIVESAFTSVPDIGAAIYWFLPVRLLARIHYNTREHLKAANGQVLIVHSRDDEIIPYDHGLALHEAAGDRASLLTISGDHNSGFLTSGDRYLNGLHQFVKEVLH